MTIFRDIVYKFERLASDLFFFFFFFVSFYFFLPLYSSYSQNAHRELVSSILSQLKQTKQVVAVGPGKADDKDGSKATPVGIATGSTVLYSRYAGTEFTGEDGSEYIVISASDVLATLA